MRPPLETTPTLLNQSTRAKFENYNLDESENWCSGSIWARVRRSGGTSFLATTRPRAAAHAKKGPVQCETSFFSAERASWPDATSSTTKCDGDVRGTTSRRVRERARRTGRCGSTAPGTGAALKKKGIHVRYMVPFCSFVFLTRVCVTQART